MLCKKSVLRNFAKLTRKHLRQSFIFNKVAGLKPVALLKKRPWHRSCPVNFAKFLRTPFLVEDLRWLCIGPFLGCQSIWYFSRNTIFSRMNIVFFSDAGDVTPRCIFSGQEHLSFSRRGQCHACVAYTYIWKYHVSMRFLIKLIFFHFPSKEKKSYFPEKKKYHLSRYYKEDSVQVRISWKDNLFRTFEENIFPGIFLRKIIFPFAPKE